jgi:transposase InsO family protein
VELFDFIDTNHHDHSIQKMAKILGVSRSGFYSAKNRPESNRSKENKVLLEKIRELYIDSKRRYGSPKIYNELRKKNIQCGKNRVAKLMRNNNMRACGVKKFKVTTDSNHSNPVAPNLLDRNFTVNCPNKVWVSDITYIYTKSGWLYLAVVIDLFSRKVVGWSISSNCNTELIIQAFLMACIARNPGKGLIFHSDRGVQYTSNKFQEILHKKDFISSMSRKGNCWDNACAESFFHSLKIEEVHQSIYYTKDQAKNSIFEYIEIFYNRKRSHSTLNYLNPEEYEKQRIA